MSKSSMDVLMFPLQDSEKFLRFPLWQFLIQPRIREWQGQSLKCHGPLVAYLVAGSKSLEKRQSYVMLLFTFPAWLWNDAPKSKIKNLQIQQWQSYKWETNKTSNTRITFKWRIEECLQKSQAIRVKLQYEETAPLEQRIWYRRQNKILIIIIFSQQCE